MSQRDRGLCFCTLALGDRYRHLAKGLAESLERHAPGIPLVVYTEKPKYFNNLKNVLAFKHYQQGILHCYHDKRLVIEKALSEFDAVICIDADTEIIADLPNQAWSPGITARQEKLLEHLQKNSQQRLAILEKVAAKLAVPLEDTSYIGESLFIVARDNGKEQKFLRLWGEIGGYFELQGIHSGEGNAMGLAAAKVGWTVQSEGWNNLRALTQHLDASHQRPPRTAWQQLQYRLLYHYRLNRARLDTLRNFSFYYR